MRQTGLNCQNWKETKLARGLIWTMVSFIMLRILQSRDTNHNNHNRRFVVLIQSFWEYNYLNVTNYIFLVAKQMIENGGGCERGLFTSISHDRKPWPMCSHSNHLSWWSKDKLNEQNNII